MSIISEKIIKEQIAKDLDLSSLNKDEQDKIVSGLIKNISLAVNIAVLDELDSEDKQELEVICNSPRENAVLDYLNSKIDNFQFLIQRVVEEIVSQFQESRSLSPA
jgi:hypothetical protein